MIRDESGGDGCRSIGEVAESLKLPQHVLRFWETRFPEVRPVKRAGGRRSYRPEDVELLRAIRDLLYGEGYTIKGVQRLLRDQGADAFRPEPVPGPEQAPPFSGSPSATRPFVAASGDLHRRLAEAFTEIEECRLALDRARSGGR